MLERASRASLRGCGVFIAFCPQGCMIPQDLLRDSYSVWELKIWPQAIILVLGPCMRPFSGMHGSLASLRRCGWPATRERNLGSEASNLLQAPLTALQLLFGTQGCASM